VGVCVNRIGKGNGTITGNGVTILLTNSTLDWKGAKDLTLTAGSSGFVFYQNPADPLNPAGHDIGGNADAAIDGIQYFGMQDVRYHGVTQQDADAPQCTVVVARKISFLGTVDMTLGKNNCASNLPEVNASTLALRLVD
jgi:hypothetical protein